MADTAKSTDKAYQLAHELHREFASWVFKLAHTGRSIEEIVEETLRLYPGLSDRELCLIRQIIEKEHAAALESKGQVPSWPCAICKKPFPASGDNLCYEDCTGEMLPDCLLARGDCPQVCPNCRPLLPVAQALLKASAEPPWADRKHLENAALTMLIALGEQLQNLPPKVHISARPRAYLDGNVLLLMIAEPISPSQDLPPVALIKDDFKGLPSSPREFLAFAGRLLQQAQDRLDRWIQLGQLRQAAETALKFIDATSWPEHFDAADKPDAFCGLSPNEVRQALREALQPTGKSPAGDPK